MPAEYSSVMRGSGNLLLKNLGGADRRLLARHVEETDAANGQVLIHPGASIDHIFFPGSGVVSLRAPVTQNRSVEVGIAGREGMVGWPALLGAHRSPHAATVSMGSGTFLRIDAAHVRQLCRESPSLSAALLLFVHAASLQISCAIAAHLEHSLGQRVVRWLLMRHDRVGGDILLAHHDEIAESLNVRRASVTDQLHLIEGQGLLRCTRGRMIVLDRAGLEASAAGAYGIAEEEYRTLIAPFGKSPACDAAGALRKGDPVEAEDGSRATRSADQFSSV